MANQDDINDQLVRGLNVLAENQSRINEKVDSILELLGNQYNSTQELKQNANNQNFALNSYEQKINNLSSQLSDLQIQFQNSFGDIGSLASDIQTLSYQIDSIKQTITQMKIYSQF